MIIAPDKMNCIKIQRLENIFASSSHEYISKDFLRKCCHLFLV